MKDIKEQLNIVMLGHKRIPSREGGVEIVVNELSTRMVKFGHQVTCLNRSGKHVGDKNIIYSNQFEHNGVNVKTVPTLDFRGVAAMIASVTGALYASFGKYEIVHFHAEGPCAMLWLPKLFGKRCIATIHGLDHQRAKWGRFAKAYIMLGEKCAVRFADEIIVLSKNVQQYFKDKYKRETTLIFNGVERPTVRDADVISKIFFLEKDSYILYLEDLFLRKVYIT